MNDQKQAHFTIEETPDAINISIRNQKDTGLFLLAIIYFLILLIIAVLLIWSAISLLLGGASPIASPRDTFLLLLAGLVLFSLYGEPIRALDKALLHEDLHITGSSIAIHRSGFLMFRKKKVIPAEKLKEIQLTIQISALGSKLGDLIMNTSNYGKLSIIARHWMAPAYEICRGISQDEAMTTLDKIHDKFPQYC